MTGDANPQEGRNLLLELTVERLALIDALRLPLQPGFNVLTGETGAGKSILLDAIGLLLGNRGSAELIRNGEDSALVEAVIALSPSTQARVKPLLEEWGLPWDESLIISRELFKSGRTVCRVNGRLATVQMLRELGWRIVQQHGQHDHHGLLRTEEQMRALDLYGHHEELLADVRTQFRHYLNCKRAYEETLLDEQGRAQRLDMLTFQIQEIEQADLQPGEEDRLRERRKKLQHVEKISTALQQAKSFLDGEGTIGALTLLGNAHDHIAAAAAYDDSLHEAAELLQTAQVHADEAARLIYRHLDELDEDPSELDAIEERLAQIRALQRKYGASVEEVLAYYETAVQERDDLLHHEEKASRLFADMQAAETALHESCERLHQARVEAAERLSSEVVQTLRALSMPSARLEVRVWRRTQSDGTVQYSEDGFDQIQFLFSANVGEELKPLQKVASGGELSRTLLALKSVLADVDDLETLIFDEIDTGVSGVAAQSVAQQMRKIATSRQVLCVTHSAAIAAAAGTHYYIEKTERDGSTQTSVRKLDTSGRIRELARLLGAGIADETAVSHAKALLERMGAKGA
jgi:DNA repair protein RecN (Recombination protein N)